MAPEKGNVIMSKAAQVVERCGVMITARKKSDFQTRYAPFRRRRRHRRRRCQAVSTGRPSPPPPFPCHRLDSDVVQDLGRLLKLGDEQQASTLPQLDQKQAMASLSCIIKYLELLSNELNFGKFELEEFNFRQHLRLDAAAARALNIFPSAQVGARVKMAAAVLFFCEAQTETLPPPSPPLSFSSAHSVSAS